MAMKRLLSRSSRAGVRQQHAHLGEAARQHEAFDDLEESVLVVQVGLEVGRVDRHQALRAGGHGIDRGAHLLERADHADVVLVACCRKPRAKRRPAPTARCENLLKSNSPVVMVTTLPGLDSQFVTCARCKPRWPSPISVPNASRFHRGFARNRPKNVCWVALYASHIAKRHQEKPASACARERQIERAISAARPRYCCGARALSRARSAGRQR